VCMGFLVHHGRYESAEQAALPKVWAYVCVLRCVCVCVGFLVHHGRCESAHQTDSSYAFMYTYVCLCVGG